MMDGAKGGEWKEDLCSYGVHTNEMLPGGYLTPSQPLSHSLRRRRHRQRGESQRAKGVGVERGRGGPRRIRATASPMSEHSERVDT